MKEVEHIKNGLGLIFLVIALAGFSPKKEHSVILSPDGWQARIVPETLTIFGKDARLHTEVKLAAWEGPLQGIEDLTASEHEVSWRMPGKGMKIKVYTLKNRLHVRIESSKEQKVSWPVTGEDDMARAIIDPTAEGLYIPLEDPFWVKERGHYCHNMSVASVPLWGYEFPGATATYFLPNNLQTKLCFDVKEGRLFTRTTHEFRDRDALFPYEVVMALTADSPIAPGLEYRAWLIENHQYVTLADKMKQNPGVEKLLGATHAYLWGDGRTLEALRKLHEIGMDRLLLLYDQKPKTQKFLVGEEFIELAKSFGYLIGPYDEFDRLHDPERAQHPAAIWDKELFETGGIMNSDGTRLGGFGGFGYELSSEALRTAKKPFIQNRVESYYKTGVNAYFLDVDATRQFFDDYDPNHPMTPERDRENRTARMTYIRSKGLVLGSEFGAGWAVPVLDYAHGMETINDRMFVLFKDNVQVYGGWSPHERPENMFRRVKIPEELKQAFFNPVYRIPLYQAVFHGSIVTTDRWEVPHCKFIGLGAVRALRELLYNVPAMWSLDWEEINTSTKLLQSQQRFFSPLHRAVGTEPLVSFEWLTPDRMVQRTQFGDRIVMTANFGSQPYGNIPPFCITAEWLKENRTETFCPEACD